MRRVRLILSITLFLVLSSSVLSQIEVEAGNIILPKFKTVEVQTSRWGGIIINLSGYLDETANSIGDYTFGSTSEIVFMILPGENLNDGKHWLAVIPENVTFNQTKLENLYPQDLEENGVFNQENFQIFHPNYNVWSDSPKKTYTYPGTVKIAGKLYQGMCTLTNFNIENCVLKYNGSNGYVPVFFVKLGRYTCYNNTICHAQLLLPLEKTYYFYILSEEVPVKLDVWIDGQKTTEFQQTALPYNLTIRATHLYTGEPLPNLTVTVFEENGHNIFVPVRLSGIISRGVSYALTDSNGYAQFVVVPTKYGESRYSDTPPYSIAVGVYYSDLDITRRLNLSVLYSDELVRQKKYISPSKLADNVKVSVVAMMQIAYTLYKWLSYEERAWIYRVEVYEDGTYSIYNYSDGKYYQNATLKTGAPNIIFLNIYYPNATVTFSEVDGYLVFNPTVNPDVITNSNRSFTSFYFKDGDVAVVTPTSYGRVSSKVYMRVYDQYGALVTEIPFSINPNLDFKGGRSYFGIVPTSLIDSIKVFVTSLNQVLYSSYYSLV